MKGIFAFEWPDEYGPKWLNCDNLKTLLYQTPDVKITDVSSTSLRQEIALLRVMLEDRFNACKNSYDIEQNTPQINSLLICLNELIKTEHKLSQ